MILLIAVLVGALALWDLHRRSKPSQSSAVEPERPFAVLHPGEFPPAPQSPDPKEKTP